MTVRSLVTAGVVASLCALAPSSVAAADVVTITHGTFVYVYDGGTPVGDIDIGGTRGFSLQSRVFGPDGHFELVDFCRFSDECTPGAVVEIAAGWGGSALPGFATLRGVTYGDLGSANGTSGGQVSFSGSVTMPEMSGSVATVVVPFGFSGSFTLALEDGSGSEVVATGGGFATVLLEAGPAGSYIVRRVEFTFRPVR